MTGHVEEGQLLWQPSGQRIAAARITAFKDWLRVERGVEVGDDYGSLHAWSVDNLNDFWLAFTDWIGVRWHDRPTDALIDESMPGTSWFPGATLNYAEQLLYPLTEADLTDEVAVVSIREDGFREQLTWRELRSQVAAIQKALQRFGVCRGDRVAGVIPNATAALVASLATASLGAIWSSCSPDFGARGVVDRFAQIEPTVLFVVDGYLYNAKPFDISPTVAELRTQLPTLQVTVLIPWLDPDAKLDDAVRWPELLADADPNGVPEFMPVPADHPLWILYSSGTTGLPKPIIHGHGGITVEHLKQLALHLDLGAGDRFCWFSTTGWMMWNLLVSALAVGSSIVVYDGSPIHPDPLTLWRMAENERLTCLGVSAPFIQACQRLDLHPRKEFGLERLRTLGSTGAPLPPEGFAWVYDEVAGPDLVLSSLSGGTDVCTAFVGGAPTLPVHAGEIPAALLGCAVEAYDVVGTSVVEQLGELVITKPMPSMPVSFWRDRDGARLKAAYFEDFPGIWRHGDWIRITDRGSMVIYGRSDSTLNRGGVRMGTSEFYRVAEDVPGVADSLVIDTSAAGNDGRLLLFVVLADGADLLTVTGILRATIRAQLSPRHVPDEVIAIPVIPRTLNGKKCEVPAKRILAGMPPEQAVAASALTDPTSMQPFVELAASAS